VSLFALVCGLDIIFKLVSAVTEMYFVPALEPFDRIGENEEGIAVLVDNDTCACFVLLIHV
jgi:hypothetical protein